MTTRQIADVARSLALKESVKASFLGAEVKALTGAEEAYADAWQKLGRGECEAAAAVIDSLLVADPSNEKLYYTRAVAYARTAKWGFAVADYSRYLKSTQAVGGAALANALYGRALCLARLGRRSAALGDLDECIRVGPHDEQATESDASLVPCAVVARFVLLQLEPALSAVRRSAPSAADPTAAAEGAPEPSGGAVYEGDVWRAPATDLEAALERVRAAGRTALLLDGTSERAVDAYFIYAPATVVEAKKLVMDVRVAGVPLADAQEELRTQLVHAMRWGHTLVLRLANSAPDFLKTFCTDEAFPLALFEQGTLPSGSDAATTRFRYVLRPGDVAASGGRLLVPPSFSVVVTSTFSPDGHAALLAESLPLHHLQPVAVFHARAGAGAGAGALPRLTPQDDLARQGGAPKAGQMQGDRTSLFLMS